MWTITAEEFNTFFSTFSDSLVGCRDSGAVVGTVATLLVLGGLGFAVMANVVAFLRGRAFAVGRLLSAPHTPAHRTVRLSVESRVVLVLTAALLLGGTLLAQESGDHPAYLRNMVTSPAGTSAAAIAWTLDQGAHVLPIPGTRSASHLRELAQGLSIAFTDEDRAEIARLLPPGWAHGDRYNDVQLVGVERYC